MFKTSFDGKIEMVSGYKHATGSRVALSVRTERIAGSSAEVFTAAVKLLLPNVGHGFNAAYYSIPAAVTIAAGPDGGGRVTVDLGADAEMWALLFEHIQEPEIHVDITELAEDAPPAEILSEPEVTVDAMVEGKHKRWRPRKIPKDETVL